MEEVKNCPRTLTQTYIRNFLGLVGYYRRFVGRFESISSCLTTLTHKNAKFEWSDACEKGLPKVEGQVYVCSGVEFIIGHPRVCGVLLHLSSRFGLCPYATW